MLWGPRIASNNSLVILAQLCNYLGLIYSRLQEWVGRDGVLPEWNRHDDSCAVLHVHRNVQGCSGQGAHSQMKRWQSSVYWKENRCREFRSSLPTRWHLKSCTPSGWTRRWWWRRGGARPCLSSSRLFHTRWIHSSLRVGCGNSFMTLVHLLQGRDHLGQGLRGP